MYGQEVSRTLPVEVVYIDNSLIDRCGQIRPIPVLEQISLALLVLEVGNGIGERRIWRVYNDPQAVS